MLGAITSWVTIIIAFVTLIFVIIRDSKNNRKDLMAGVEKEATKFDEIKDNMLKVNVKLDTLCSTANETRSDVKVTARDIVTIQNHISGIDERLNSFEKRITDLEHNVYDKP